MIILYYIFIKQKMTKMYNFQYYYTLLCEYIKKYHKTKLTWDGKIIRKYDQKLYRWWVEIRNGRRRLKPNHKLVLLNSGIYLDDIVSDYISHPFSKWLHILEDYLNTNYYYGINNSLRTDKQHISNWDGILKKKSGNFKGNNLYQWYQRIRKNSYKMTPEQKTILKMIGLNMNKLIINKRLSFDEWIEIIKEYKEDNGSDEWDGIINKNARKYKNHNLYEYINSLRDKNLTKEQQNRLLSLGIKTTLSRKKIINNQSI